MSNEQLKIELALKILDKIDWNVETITVIETKVNLVRNVLSHPVFWTPAKKKRGKNEHKREVSSET